MTNNEYITITFNDETQSILSGTSLEKLLASTSVLPSNIATAINGEFIARGQRATRTLLMGDVVLTFQAITGG